MNRKKYQKMNAIILLVVFLANFLPTGMVVADTGTTLFFTSDSITANSCAESTLIVGVADVVDLTAFHLEVTFDPEVIEVKSVNNGGFLTFPDEDDYFLEPTNEIDNVNGLILFGMTQQGSLGDPNPKSGDGNLIEIKFKAKTPVTVGQETDITIDGLNSLLVDWPDVFEIDFAVSTGTATVTTEACEPTLSSDTVAGPFMVGLEQEFEVTLNNPSNGTAYDNVLVQFLVEGVDLTDIASFQYLETAGDPDEWLDLPLQVSGDDLIGYFGPIGGFPISAPYDATSYFKVTFNTAGNYPATFHLVDLSTDPDTIIAEYQTVVEVLDELTVSVIDLKLSTDQSSWSTVPGTIDDGYEIGLDDTVEYYYLDVDTFTTNRDLADGMYPFYMDTTPDGFFDYWAEKGVVEGATGWQAIMWEIINGDEPVFYLKVENGTTTLVDGLVYLLSGEEEYPRINGDYLEGEYTFNGTIQDENGFSADISVGINFIDASLPELEGVSPAEGLVVLGSTETFVFEVDAKDVNLYKLEIDHSLEGSLPEFSVYANPDNPYGDEETKTVFEDTYGVFVTYDATEQVWTIDFGASISQQFVDNEGVTLYVVLHDEAGNKWGSMNPTTADNTFVYTITQNSVPVAVDDDYSVEEDEVLTVAAPGVLGNDTDANGDTLTAVLDIVPTYGTLLLNADGSFTYTPDADYFGSDSFTYNVNDGFEDSSTPATVTITVHPVNDDPVAVDDEYTTEKNTLLEKDAVAGVLANDIDVDGDEMVVSMLIPPVNGLLQLFADGSFIYQPDADYVGEDTFTYQLITYPSDDVKAGWTDSATVTINVVESPNNAPVAVDDEFETDKNTPLEIDAPGVLVNDTDADSDSLTAEVVDDPENGTLTVNADGSFTYTPDADFVGTDTFTYMANDGTVDSNTATVTIEVKDTGYFIYLPLILK